MFEYHTTWWSRFLLLRPFPISGLCNLALDSVCFGQNFVNSTRPSGSLTHQISSRSAYRLSENALLPAGISPAHGTTNVVSQDNVASSSRAHPHTATFAYLSRTMMCPRALLKRTRSRDIVYIARKRVGVFVYSNCSRTPYDPVDTTGEAPGAGIKRYCRNIMRKLRRSSLR